MGLFDFLFPSVEDIFPVSLVIKAIIIVIIGLVTILGAFFAPKGKFAIIIIGLFAILVIWYINITFTL